MQPPLVTLTTDFGPGSTYVAAMKGALLSIAHDTRVIDLSHDIPPQDIRAAALFLRDTLHYFPAGSIHVAIVDPGVGSARAALLVEWAGSFILAPDNGVWTVAIPTPDKVWRLNQPRFWRNAVSPTFHGRDIFGPVAGHLAMGTNPALVGEPVFSWCRLDLPVPMRQDGVSSGEVICVDRFGNLITNLHREQDSNFAIIMGRQVEIVRTYADRPAGSLVALTSSNGLLEIAIVNGSAAALLQASVGTPVELASGLVS